MSFLEDLREARRSPSAAYQQFALKYPKTSEDIHAFLEGRDDPSFYLSFLLRVVSDINKIHLYRCNNKSGVYDAYSKVMRLAKQSSFVLFFVDKDHSDLIGEKHQTASNIYVTDFYSIENYIVTEEMLHRVWEDFFSSINLSLDYDSVASKFRNELEQYYRLILPLSAWIVFNRRRGLRPNINNVKLGQLYAFNKELTVETVSMADLLAHLEQVCGIECPSDLSSELPNVMNELQNIEPKRHIRGKYELWFFIKFIEQLIITLKNENGSSIKIRTQIGEANAVEILGPRVQMPSSLHNFFVQNGLTSV